jgi:uncharacterized membrane protein YhaH (DUF805 family)
MTLSAWLFSFSGRLNRARYWLTILGFSAIFLIGSLLSFTGKHLGGVRVQPADLQYRDWSVTTIVIAGVLILLAILVGVWIGLAVAIKRLHDRDKSAWWLLLFYLVPSILPNIGGHAGPAEIVLALIGLGISIWAFVEIGCLRGTAGPNRYGPDPLQLRY